MVEGERIKPYELPDDPLGNASQLRRIEEDEAVRREHDDTAFQRGVTAVSAGLEHRRGRVVFRRRFFRRWEVELRKLRREHKLLLWSGHGDAQPRWMIEINLWRAG